MRNNISFDVIDKITDEIKKDKIQKIVVGALIVVEKDSILLLKRAENDFMGGLVELPSGTLEPNEDLIKGLIREVKEETNLDVESVDSFIGTFDYVSGSGKKTRQVNLRVTTSNLDVKLSCEHEKYYICSVGSNEFKNLNISTKTRDIISKAISI